MILICKISEFSFSLLSVQKSAQQKVQQLDRSRV